VTVYDQAPAGDDVTQATAANQPLYVASIQNGHAGMYLDGTNDYLQGAFTTGGALSQPFNVFAVAQLDASVVGNNTYRQLIEGADATHRLGFFQDSGPAPDAWTMQCGAILTGGATDANWRIWSLLANGASSEFWKNGVSEAAGNAGADNTTGIIVGAFYTVASFWKGNVVSIVIIDPSLSDAQRALMEAAMNAYWTVY